MTSPNAAINATPPAAPFAVQTRFGEMTVDPDTVLRLPRGLMGFSSLRDFALANLPQERYGRFKVLQSLESPELSFIVLPYETTDALITESDLDAGMTELGIAREDSAALLIVSIRKTGEKAIVSVNLRAPIVVDLKRRLAWQHVLANPEYSVRHTL